MTLPVFLAVMLAAFLHAFWNALVKTGANKQTGMLILSVGNALAGLCVILWRPLPDPGVWPWILASALIHTAYQLFLAFAYEQGDLSRVYPIARGAAPMLVLVATALFAVDPLERAEVLGIVVLGLGILLMARGVFSRGEPRRMLPFALGSAAATAGYSVVDGIGARISGDPVAYVGWILLFAAAFYVPAIVALRGRATLVATGRAWRLGLVAAAASYTAYAIVVWAMTTAPIALVAALRETSILFAVLIGWLAFHDRMDAGKAVAAGLILGGALLTRL